MIFAVYTRALMHLYLHTKQTRLIKQYKKKIKIFKKDNTTKTY